MTPLVQEAIAHYHELVLGAHLDATREHLARAIARDPLVSECHVLRPYFMDAKTYEANLEVTRLLHAGLLVAARRLLEDPALRRSIGFPEYVDRILDLDREVGRPSVMARFDGLFDARGDFKAIEYNSQPEFSPAQAINQTFSTAPVSAEFARAYRYRSMTLYDDAIQALHDDAGGASTAPITIAVPGGSDAGRLWLRYAQSKGHRVTFAPFEQFRFTGGRLVVDEDGRETQVDTVILAWEDVVCPMEEMDGVFAAIGAGAVRVLEGLSRGFLCSYKHTFELLSDPVHAGTYEPDVAAALARHVPWTRVVRERKTAFGSQTVDLVPFVAENRERLVLKPSGGSQGQGVIIGRRVTDDQWSQTLKRALKQQYVVQELVGGEELEYPTVDGSSVRVEKATSDWNPFVWAASRVAGCQVRLTTTGIHNVDDGGSMTGVWLIDGRC